MTAKTQVKWQAKDTVMGRVWVRSVWTTFEPDGKDFAIFGDDALDLCSGTTTPQVTEWSASHWQALGVNVEGLTDGTMPYEDCPLVRRLQKAKHQRKIKTALYSCKAHHAP